MHSTCPQYLHAGICYPWHMPANSAGHVLCIAHAGDSISVSHALCIAHVRFSLACAMHTCIAHVNQAATLSQLSFSGNLCPYAITLLRKTRLAPILKHLHWPFLSKALKHNVFKLIGNKHPLLRARRRPEGAAEGGTSGILS